MKSHKWMQRDKKQKNEVLKRKHWRREKDYKSNKKKAKSRDKEEGIYY